MATFSVRFLGCKVSQADAMLIRDALRDAGHVEAPRDAAQVHVVNTCALTLEAERKSRQQVNRAARAGRTFVTGCAANLNGGQFGEDVTVVGRSADRAAIEIVERLGGAGALACQDDALPPGRTRAFLKVQNGCDQHCSFCIIPRTRGAAESRPLEAILRDAERRLSEGHPELVLTGINIGTWRGADGSGLADLVRRIGALPRLRRLRISSIEPGDVDLRLAAAMAETPTVARHLHIPLQSADDAVLRAMGRSYDVAGYVRAVEWARELLPDVNITTDVIIGFPAEDGKVHVFPFSPRPGTAAAAMGDLVPPAEKDRRSRELRDLSDRLGFARRRDRVGGTDEVIVERVLEDGTLTGYGSDYCRFVIDPCGARPGDLVPVRVAGMAGEHLRGERNDG